MSAEPFPFRNSRTGKMGRGGTTMKLVLVITLLAASIACNPGVIQDNCDAQARTSQGLGKAVCKFGNLF